VADAEPQKVKGQRAGRDGERDAGDDAADGGTPKALTGTDHGTAHKAARPRQRRFDAGDGLEGGREPARAAGVLWRRAGVLPRGWGKCINDCVRQDQVFARVHALFNAAVSGGLAVSGRRRT